MDPAGASGQRIGHDLTGTRLSPVRPRRGPKRPRVPQGLPLPGVTVTVTSAGAPRTSVTDEQGRFFVAFLTPGIYGVRAELSGFSPAEQSARRGVRTRAAPAT